MHDGRYISTDLRDDETLAEYQHRRFLARRDREDDYTPVCAEPGCPNLVADGAYCGLHREDAA